MGVQDQIRNDLAKIADLKVISRNSVMQYKPEAKRNLREIAEALGVAYAVEGSVQRTADRVQVRRNIETTIQVLNDLGVVVYEWPGAGLLR